MPETIKAEGSSMTLGEQGKGRSICEIDVMGAYSSGKEDIVSATAYEVAGMSERMKVVRLVMPISVAKEFANQILDWCGVIDFNSSKRRNRDSDN